MSMKKKMLILFISFTILLSGCQKDPLSEQVSQEISQLENVTLDDEDTVTELENTYENMTDKQKNQVKNYVALREAKKKIEELKKIQNMAEEAYDDPEYNIAVDACHAIEYAVGADDVYVDSAQIYDDGHMIYFKIGFTCNADTGLMIKSMIFTYKDYKFSNFYEEGDSLYNILNDHFTLPGEKEKAKELNTDVIMCLLE